MCCLRSHLCSLFFRAIAWEVICFAILAISLRGTLRNASKGGLGPQDVKSVNVLLTEDGRAKLGDVVGSPGFLFSSHLLFYFDPSISVPVRHGRIVTKSFPRERLGTEGHSIGRRRADARAVRGECSWCLDF
jgi:hypothetical protein